MQLLLSITIALLSNLAQIGTAPQIIEQEGAYTKYALTDSTSLEVYEAGDSIIMVMTACAPQCSSCARIYNKECKPIRDLTPPFSSIFPLATINKTNGEIIWTDNDTWNYQSTL